MAGDRDAFGVLVDRYISLVHGVILERVRRPDEVEDLVQDTFTKVYQRLGTLREPARFGSWTCRVAANLAIDWLQRQRRRLHLEQARDVAFDLGAFPRVRQCSNGSTPARPRPGPVNGFAATAKP